MKLATVEQKRGRWRTVLSGRGAAGAVGAVVLLVALGSPLRVASEGDVAAHMVQHLLLMSVAAPLLAFAVGHPDRLLPWPRARRWVHGRGALLAGATASLYAVVLWGWHLPALYDTALGNPALHAVQHLSMLGGAVALWAVLLSAGRLVSHLVAFAALLPTAVHSAALGALITVAPRPLYASAAASEGGLADQQVAGTLMWGIGGLPFMAAAAALVVSWVRRSEARSLHRAAVRATAAARVAPALLLAVVVAGCGSASTRQPSTSVPLPDADPDAGRELIQAYGCGACHEIPGVRGADAQVAPPLDAWSRRAFIAGSVPNEPDNLVRWISDPQSVRPGTAMPDLGISPEMARDIAAYLLSLE